MTPHSLVTDIDTTVQELRLEQHRGGFKDKLGRIVSALGRIPDSTPIGFTRDDITRLRELVEQAVEAIEGRLDANVDNQDVQQHLAGTVYEIRKRMEVVSVWFRHQAGN
jgi:hypothetical protein